LVDKHEVAASDYSQSPIKCPFGTTPVVQVLPETVIAAAAYKATAVTPSLSRFQYALVPPTYPDAHFHAIYSTGKAAAAPAFFAARTRFHLWRPTVSGALEFSLVQMWLNNFQAYNWQCKRPGQDPLEAGFQVYPQRMGDTHSHLFIYRTNNNYASDGVDSCYDYDCNNSDFVNLNRANGWVP
jgi:hypothetical protein